MIANLLPASIRPWYLAARPRSLPATWAPLLIGASVALVDGVFNPARFALALVGALLLQIASNYINEYVDFKRGTDAQKSDGMGMVLTKGQLSANQVLIGAIVSVVAGALIGLVLVALSGLTLLWIGMFGVLVVIAYTAGPLPLAYIGLGEAAVFLAMGPLMTFGTYYAVSGGHESTAAWLAGLPIAFTVAAILHANNMRDIDSDRAAHKLTLAVRFGMNGARWEFRFLIYGAYITAAILVILNQVPWTTLLVLGTIPGAIQLVRFTCSTDDPKLLHKAQGLTAQLHWRVGVVLTLGWIMMAFIINAANNVR